jgi:glucose/arabinose dehydrogenase
MTRLIIALSVFASATALAQPPLKLPPPFSTPSASAPPKIVNRPDGAELRLPKGFTIEEFAAGFQRPRFMALGPSGEILLSDFVPNGAVYVFINKTRKPLIQGLDRPYGLAIWKDYLYVAETTSVKRYKYDSTEKTVGAGEEIIPMKDFGKGHVTHPPTSRSHPKAS